jgi:hypothetical protein
MTMVRVPSFVDSNKAMTRWSGIPFATICIVATSACLAPPGYADAKASGRRVGFDGTAQQLGRWACGHNDLVLTEDQGKHVMHDLNNDLVVPMGKRFADGREAFAGFAHAGDAPTGVQRWLALVDTKDLANPIDLEDEIVVEAFAGAGGTVQVISWKCPAAPRVELHR